MKPRTFVSFFLAVALAAVAAPAWPQVVDSLVLQVTPGVLLPMGPSAGLFNTGGRCHSRPGCSSTDRALLPASSKSGTG